MRKWQCQYVEHFKYTKNVVIFSSCCPCDRSITYVARKHSTRSSRSLNCPFSPFTCDVRHFSERLLTRAFAGLPRIGGLDLGCSHFFLSCLSMERVKTSSLWAFPSKYIFQDILPFHFSLVMKIGRIEEKEGERGLTLSDFSTRIFKLADCGLWAVAIGLDKWRSPTWKRKSNQQILIKEKRT